MVDFSPVKLHFASQKSAEDVAIPPLNTYLFNEEIKLKEIPK